METKVSKRNICVVTGSRADYGLLFWLMKEIQNDINCKLQVAVTGMHLSPEFGLTLRNIEDDGFSIDAKVETILSSDTSIGVAKSIGLGIIGFADTFAKLKPDIVVLLGDRYEIFAAAQAAFIAKIPIGHIAGGDVTEGALDDAMRHSITKMSQLHFATNAVSAQRLKRLGENPKFIFNTGSSGIDTIKRLRFCTRAQLEKELNLKFKKRNFLITFHPATLSERSEKIELQELLDALTEFSKDTLLIFTQTNSDTGGRGLSDIVSRYCVSYPNRARAFTNLGQKLYLSVMAIADVVIGNSSSGLYEAPSLKKPTVNIGDRQKGRSQAKSVVNCAAKKKEIASAIRHALTIECSDIVNPYGDGNSAKKIFTILKETQYLDRLVKKRFFDAD